MRKGRGFFSPSHAIRVTAFLLFLGSGAAIAEDAEPKGKARAVHVKTATKITVRRGSPLWKVSLSSPAPSPWLSAGSLPGISGS